MNKNVEQLILILTKEHEIYERITILAEEKKMVIIDGNIKELEAITKKEQTYSMSLVKLEKLRSKIVDQLLLIYNLVEVNNVSDLFPYMSEAERRAVTIIKDEIMSEVGKIQVKNDQNKKLIEQSLELIDFNMEILTTVDNNNEYGANAGDTSKAKRSIFDVKV